MWDTVDEAGEHLSHDLPCQRCGHAGHRYLPCECGCSALASPGDRRAGNPLTAGGAP